MKSTAALVFVLFIINLCHSQSPPEGRKGQIYFYWGWNFDSYSNSDIHFRGEDYNFTLDDVSAKERRTKFSLNTYFNPGKVTIPQFNFRLGYFVNDDYNISFGLDHMKYVVNKGQIANISGHISNTGTEYDGDYSNDPILIEEGFLLFEHTDGLNYLNLELRRFNEWFTFHSIKVGLTQGIGAGILLPKTNTSLLNQQRYDEFHLSGYAVAGVLGLNVNYFKSLFFQTEVKGGFINMPDIRTTSSEADRASQHFFFSQINIVFGASIKF